MWSVRCLCSGNVKYGDGLHWQRETATALREGHGSEAIALIEHESVYTIGARGGRATLRVPLEELPAPLVDTDRGGDVTWHGPGQLVAYPILHLRRRGIGAGEYLAGLEGMLLDTLAAFGIRGERVSTRRGIWVDGNKVAAMGVRIQGGVSMHGIALNIAPDLGWFDAIVPCGIADAGVTSMAALLGAAPPFAAVVEAMRAAFESRFATTLVEVPADALRAAVPA